jgi:hypothetical protein
MNPQKLHDIITFANQYVEEDRFAETLGRILMTLDVEADRISVLLVALAVVHADQQAEAGRNLPDQDAIDAVYSDLIMSLPHDVRQRFLDASRRALHLHNAVRSLA